MNIKIQQGDNIELLKGYPDKYFDSVVTDCPYGLGKEPNALKLMQDWIDHGYHEVRGKGFMGKSWDAFVPQPVFWKEVFRVLKPGGHVLAFFGTRTYDWGTLAIRLAGFEIRDMICWHYGSGFPKSLDISKQIDKMAGAEREVIGTKKTGADNKRSKNTMRIAKNTFVDTAGETVFNLTGASTDEAKQWDGYGTALKPATEPICVARKPIEGTVAENVLKYGTGGINLDGCRIEFESEQDLASATFGTGTNIIGGNYVGSKLTDGRKNIEANNKGRFPANVIFDPLMAEKLDEQSGELQSGGGRKGEEGKRNYLDNTHSNSLSGARSSTAQIHHDPIRGAYTLGKVIADSGGASRFFYCAKASQYERNAGCELLNKKIGGMVSNTSGQHLTRREDDYNPDPVANFHPTVKPLTLMSYLQRLVTPKGGKTLDPFAGSGTSGCSAYFENIGEIVLMEMDETYLPIIEARTAYWSVEYNRRKYLEDLKDFKEQPENQLKLFMA